ncbi:MAG: winged helix-turn-helix domain-containing protein [Bacillota bacterium]|nr:winged helix-turn-helix domain-containing protein [Bacillota bacterium]
MEINYKKELHPLLETLGLIYIMKNFQAVKAEIVSSLEEMKVDGEGFYKKNLSYLEEYVKEFEKKYVPNSNEDFFFGYNTEFFLTVSAIAVEYPELETAIDTLTDEEILHIIESFFTEDGQQMPVRLDTMEKRFALIQSTEYSEDAKWKILTLLNNPLEKFKALFEIYRKNRPAFDHTVKKNKECLESLLSEAPSDVSPVMKNIITELTDGKVTVHLTAVFPLAEWMTSITVFQGVLTDKLNFYKKGLSDAREVLPTLLKILGDKSKFEILCSLKERGKYNLEIAKELQLTPATASHHMGILLSNHFVTVEKREGKVYYQLNRESIKEIIRYLEEVLL